MTTKYIRRIKREVQGVAHAGAGGAGGAGRGAPAHHAGAGGAGGAGRGAPAHQHHQPKKARGAHNGAQTTTLEYKASGDTPAGAGPVPDFAAVTGLETINVRFPPPPTRLVNLLVSFPVRVCVCVCGVCVWLFRRLWLLSPARVPSTVPPAAPKLLALLRHARAHTHTHHLPGIAAGQRRFLLHLYGHLNHQP